MLKKDNNSLNLNLRNSTRRATSKLVAAKDASVIKPTLRPVSIQADNNYNKSLGALLTSQAEEFLMAPSPTPKSMAMSLPSSEFFIADKDSILLSESEIFQVNNNESSSPIRIKRSKIKSKMIKNYQNINNSNEDEEETFSYETDHDEKKRVLDLYDTEKENFNLENRNFNRSNVNNVQSALKRPISYPIAARSSNTPAQNHVILSDKEKDKQLDKGLRHFSAKVCAKVEEKGVTTYNEVADDLVQQIGLELGKCDHKNIRRRVYDALNVLMAIDIIRKEKKEIRWLGLPNETVDDLRELEIEKAALQERIGEKSRNLKEILRRCISLKNLIDRNSETNLIVNTSNKLSLPFILISSARDCHVHCEMLEDRTQYFFEFNTSFQINEDIELMRLMGLDTGKVEKIKSFFPKELVAQVLMLCLNNNNNNSTDFDMTNSGGQLTPVNNSVFAPIINTEDLNLGDLDSFNSSSLSSSM